MVSLNRYSSLLSRKMYNRQIINLCLSIVVVNIIPWDCLSDSARYELAQKHAAVTQIVFECARYTPIRNCYGQYYFVYME